MIKNIITISKKKIFYGVILALLISLPCFLFYSWKAGIVFGVCVLVISIFKVENNQIEKIIKIIWFVLAIVGTCVSSQLILETTAFWELNIYCICLEMLSVTVVCIAIYCILMDTRWSVILGTFSMLSLSVVDYYVLKFRGNDFTPMDIFSAGTAANVAVQYKYTIGPTVYYGIVIWILCLFASSIFNWKRANFEKLKIVRLKVILVEILLIVICWLGCSKVRIETWAREGARINGYFVNFSAQLFESLKDKKPDNYSTNVIENYENNIIHSENSYGNEELPNVLVIMNESFADFRVLGECFNTNKSVMPFYDSLQDNTIKGYALASVFGGGTANSEYEVLTGNSMGFITAGATVYQLYLKDDNYSMARHLGKMGYTCIATHPYRSSGWSRTKAWPYLGFEEITFIEDYPQEDMIRGYVSDKEMYEYIISKYENKENNKPLFLFGITMQNHGGYNDQYYESEIFLENTSKVYTDTEQYLGLIHESDAALEYLINYFEQVEKETVILFFGDHMPRVDEEFYKEIHGGSYDTLEEQQLQYTVPFFVWANYDIVEKDIELTSLNYLSNYVYEAAGIELPAYNQILSEVNEVIPAMNSLGYYSKCEEKFLEYKDAPDKDAEFLDIYKNLQYNAIFEKDSKSKVFFPIS